MRINNSLWAILFLASVSVTAPAQVPHSFESGQAASAAEVNANFNALVEQIGQLQTQVQALQALTSPSTQNIAGTYRLIEISVDVDGFEAGAGVAGEHVTGTVTLNANGTGVFEGSYNYRQISLFNYPATVRAAGGANDTTLEQTDFQLNVDGGPELSEFTWAINGNVVTVTVPPETVEDTEEILTFYAASTKLLISGDNSEGQSALSILIRQ